MVHHNLDQTTMSESTEMYLLKITLLQQQNQPVPIPLLAQELAVSPVSANEMCRKLTAKNLIRYEPYKGVTLTTVGQSLAQRILRHRRLWEVFFVEKLNIDAPEAEVIACRFEHVTPESLAEHLAEFLDHPAFSPQNQPIPRANGNPEMCTGQPLTSFAVGTQGQVIKIDTDKITRQFLHQQGLSTGIAIEILGVADDGSLLLQIMDQRLSLTATIAEAIYCLCMTE